MNFDKLKKGVSLKNILILQLIIIIYTTATVMAKFAAGYDFLSLEFLLFYGLEFVILAVYAVLWQQIIKKFDLTVAYANRSIALLWSMLWAVLFFGEIITVKNIIGVVIVIIGTIIVNSDE